MGGGWEGGCRDAGFSDGVIHCVRQQGGLLIGETVQGQEFDHLKSRCEYIKQVRCPRVRKEVKKNFNQREKTNEKKKPCSFRVW